MYPASRRHVIRTCFQLARKRGSALSAKFVKLLADHVICELGIGDRSAVHDAGKMRGAARYAAHNPNASLREIAAAVDMSGKKPKKTTVHSWRQRRDYQAFYDDEMWLLRHNAKQEKERRKAKEEEG